MWVVPFIVMNALKTTLNKLMSATTHLTQVVVRVNTTEPLIEINLLRSYLEVANFLWKKFVNDQTIAEMDSNIFRLAQMSSMRNANALSAKFCKVTDVYVEFILNNASIEGIDLSICHIVQKYWATQPLADVTDGSFKAQLLSAI